MGSLTSGPSVPSTTTYVSAPTSTTAAANTNDEPSAEQNSSVARQKSLLGRERGRFGTVSTSFRGLMSAIGGGQKKKLLGE